MSFKSLVILFVSVVCFSVVYAEESPYELKSTDSDWSNYAVEAEVVYNKKYPHQKTHELSLSSNLYFRNDLNSTFGLGGNYTYHFDEYHSWEALNLVYLNNRETLLREEIQQKTGLVPDAEDNELFLSSAYVLHPTYGKIAWFGQKIIHFDNYLLAGAGLRKISAGLTIKPLGVLGAGFRFYINRKISLRLEVRDFLFFEQHESSVDLIQAFVPTAGFSYRL